MSRDVMEMLARRWHCSVQDVAVAITKRLESAGLIDGGTAHLPAPGTKARIDYVIGVTPDDRVFLLDADDNEILEL